MRGLLLALLATGCTPLNRATLVASTVAIACDWGQTRSAASVGWMWMNHQKTEENVMLGPAPSPAAVDMYFITALLANAMVYAALPKRFGWVSTAAVIGVQSSSIESNLSVVPHPYCGL